MSYKAVRNVKDFWGFIGSSWDRFETKDPIEYYWEAVGTVTDRLTDKLIIAQQGRSLEYMSGLIDDQDNFYLVVYSGIESNIIPIETGVELFHYRLDSDDILSIPTLVRYYNDTQDTLLSGVYVEGVDYTISGLNTLVWQRASGWPPTDPRYTNGNLMNLYAEHVYRVNPILLDVWAKAINFNTSAMLSGSYYPFVSGTITLSQQYEHIKQLIWGLNYKRVASPTIKTLRDAFGIARGLPFAYNAGTMTSAYNVDHYDLTIGDDVYVLPAGVNPIPDGAVGKFDILVSGLNLYDWVNGYDVLAPLVSHPWRIRKTLKLSLDTSIESFTYDADFFSAYSTKITPVHFLHIGTAPVAFSVTKPDGLSIVATIYPQDITWTGIYSGTLSVYFSKDGGSTYDLIGSGVEWNYPDIYFQNYQHTFTYSVDTGLHCFIKLVSESNPSNIAISHEFIVGDPI